MLLVIVNRKLIQGFPGLEKIMENDRLWTRPGKVMEFE